MHITILLTLSLLPGEAKPVCVSGKTRTYTLSHQGWTICISIRLEYLPGAFGRFFKPNFVNNSGPFMVPCYSQKTDFSNELLFFQFDATILEPIYFKVGAILKKMPWKTPQLQQYNIIQTTLVDCYLFFAMVDQTIREKT